MQPTDLGDRVAAQRELRGASWFSDLLPTLGRDPESGLELEVDVTGWPFTKTVGPGFYLEPEGDGRLLASPMDEGASAPCDAQPEEEDIALAAWNVEQATTLEIRRLASKWAGLRNFAPDRLPVAGFEPNAPGFFWLAGQGGYGFQTAPA
ncbi:FAD-binding oxidoreductase, partial [uncultured Nocardioides sp.]|uniref:NAD(P)/FAD-dependent oxidoreductase n=1 Tax=uncultured Nocardioides sp. TaxID=198441 RepID=UPI002633BC3A